ncbi:MAG: 50S ribosomal protein L10 [Pedosphaera sp.]|nr:50S ribosomal protein L10 [Pedosphaera sp.]MSU42749.1 50S ribosomal protein L10 [Pedosphaera sp.]
MREEKKLITAEYLARLNASPFFIAAEYTGMTVSGFTELRKRLRGAGAEVHVVKNTVFRAAAKEAGITDLSSALTGQLAMVTGKADIFAAAKVVKTFAKEFDKPKIRFGYLGSQALTAEEVGQMADLPSLDALRGQLAGLLLEPAARIARVIQLHVDKTTGGEVEQPAA